MGRGHVLTSPAPPRIPANRPCEEHHDGTRHVLLISSAWLSCDRRRDGSSRGGSPVCPCGGTIGGNVRRFGCLGRESRSDGTLLDTPRERPASCPRCLGEPGLPT